MKTLAARRVAGNSMAPYASNCGRETKSPYALFRIHFLHACYELIECFKCKAACCMAAVVILGKHHNSGQAPSISLLTTLLYLSTKEACRFSEYRKLSHAFDTPLYNGFDYFLARARYTIPSRCTFYRSCTAMNFSCYCSFNAMSYLSSFNYIASGIRSLIFSHAIPLTLMLLLLSAVHWTYSPWKADKLYASLHENVLASTYLHYGFPYVIQQNKANSLYSTVIERMEHNSRA